MTAKTLREYDSMMSFSLSVQLGGATNRFPVGHVPVSRSLVVRDQVEYHMYMHVTPTNKHSRIDRAAVSVFGPIARIP